MQKISNTQYNRIKLNLEEMEKTNYDSIIIIPCSGSQGWHEIAERSALFYYYGVCEKFHLNNHFFADNMSLYNPYSIGYMRTLNPGTIRTNLKRAKLYKSEETKSFFTVFKLSRSYTIEEIRELEDAERERRLKNLTVEEAVNLDPELHQILVNLSARLHHICNSTLDKLSARTRGVEIVNLIDNALVEYHQITFTKNLPKSTILNKLTNMRREIYQLIFLVKVLGEARVWDLEVCISISESLKDAKNRIELNIKRFTKKPKQDQKKNA